MGIVCALRPLYMIKQFVIDTAIHDGERNYLGIERGSRSRMVRLRRITGPAAGLLLVSV